MIEFKHSADSGTTSTISGSERLLHRKLKPSTALIPGKFGPVDRHPAEGSGATASEGRTAASTRTRAADIAGVTARVAEIGSTARGPDKPRQGDRRNGRPVMANAGSQGEAG